MAVNAARIVLLLGFAVAVKLYKKSIKKYRKALKTKAASVNQQAPVAP